MGSSSIRRWEDLALDFADYDVVQRGFGGSQFSDLLGLTGADAPNGNIVTRYDPSAIVVFEGTNDVAAGKTAATVVADYREFVRLVRVETPAPILYIGITPAPSRRDRWDVASDINGRIAAIARTDPSLTYIDSPASYLVDGAPPQPGTSADFVSDDLHLSRTGYDKFRDTIRPAVTGVVAAPAFTANPDTLRLGETLLLDLGPDDGNNGRDTDGPDARGNLWNNWQPTNGNQGVLAGERVNDLVTAAGRRTGVDLVVTGGFTANGRNNGGLLNPDPTLLGDFAVGTVTEDYFFTGGPDAPGALMIDGLDPDAVFEVSLFGTRTTDQNRVTEYTLSGLAEESKRLQTSGPGSGGAGNPLGNDNALVVFEGFRPDPNGKLFLDVERIAGDFAYLGGVRLVVVPEPGLLGLLTLGATGLLRRRPRARG